MSARIPHAVWFLLMHVTTMLTVILMTKFKADDRLTMAVAAGWFGFLSADKMRKPETQYLPIATPVPTTIVRDR